MLKHKTSNLPGCRDALAEVHINATAFNTMLCDMCCPDDIVADEI